MAASGRKIVRISAPRGRLGRQQVVLDSGDVLLVRAQDLQGSRLQLDADIDGVELEQLRSLDAAARATGIAFRLLTFRMRSRQELASRLRRRGFSDETIRSVLTRLETAGLVDDVRFAETWLRGRMVLQPSGARKLRWELWQKGIARDVIERTIASALSSEGERELALRVARARRSRYRSLPQKTAVRRLAGALQRRGFSAEVIAWVIRQTLGQSIEPAEEHAGQASPIAN